MTTMVNVAHLKPGGAKYFAGLSEQARILVAWNGAPGHIEAAAPFRAAITYLSSMHRFDCELVIPAHQALFELANAVGAPFHRSVIVCPTVRFLQSFIIIEDDLRLCGYSFDTGDGTLLQSAYAAFHVREMLRQG